MNIKENDGAIGIGKGSVTNQDLSKSNTADTTIVKPKTINKTPKETPTTYNWLKQILIGAAIILLGALLIAFFNKLFDINLIP